MKLIDPVLNAFERFGESTIGRYFAGVLIIAMGVVLTWIGGEEFWAMVSDIATNAPVVTVTNASVVGPLMGPPCVLIGTWLLLGKADWLRPKTKDFLAVTTIVYALVCIVIFPFSSPILRAFTASILEARGYFAEDVESTRSFWTIKWRSRMSEAPSATLKKRLPHTAP